MNGIGRWAVRSLSVGVAYVVATGAAGCAKDQSTLFIRQVQAPAAAPACTYSNDIASLSLSHGTLDVGLRASYDATLLVGSQLVGRGSAELVRTETSRIAFKRAEVTIEDAAGAPIDAYSIPLSGFVDEAAGGQPSFGLAGVTLVAGRTSAALRGQLVNGQSRLLVSKVRVFGTSLGGKDVESDEFSFPITVCLGCLVTFPKETTDPTLSTRNCRGVSSKATDVPPCTMGQDYPVACSDCASINPEICPSLEHPSITRGLRALIAASAEAIDDDFDR